MPGKNMDFVVLTNPRSGSYFFIDSLSSTEKIRCHGELFKPNLVELDKEYREALDIGKNEVNKRDKSPLKFLGDVYKVSNDKAITGFKLFFRHNPVVIDHVISNKKIKKIILLRNPVQAYISLKMAEKSGAWTSKVESNMNHNKILINVYPLEFRKYCTGLFNIIFGCVYILEKTKQEYLLLDYLDITTSQSGLDAAVDFLGVDQTGTYVSSYKKQIEKSYNDLVENWNDLKIFLDRRGVNENSCFMDFFSDWYNISNKDDIFKGKVPVNHI